MLYAIIIKVLFLYYQEKEGTYMKDAILIKGNKYGLTIIINEDVTFDAIKEALFKKLNESRKFFGKSKVSLTFEGKSLSIDEQKALIETVESASDLDILCIIDSQQETEHSKELVSRILDIKNSVVNLEEVEPKKPVTHQVKKEEILVEDELVSSRTAIKKEPKKQINKTKFIDNNFPEGTAIFHKGTLRSGQEVISESSIIVMGNVHNGASVAAKGNVIVIGKLNGCVHAGKDGNEGAFVVALNMSPTQLRIADVFGRAPDKKGGKLISTPQIAFVEDERIVIENINRNIYENLKFINYQ